MVIRPVDRHIRLSLGWRRKVGASGCGVARRPTGCWYVLQPSLDPPTYTAGSWNISATIGPGILGFGSLTRDNSAGLHRFVQPVRLSTGLHRGTWIKLGAPETRLTLDVLLPTAP
jgi:hypothetical protein